MADDVYRAVMAALFAACVSLISMLPSAGISPGIALGGVLTRYLWLFRGVRTLPAHGVLFAVCVGAFAIAMFASLPLSVAPRLFDDHPSWGPTRTGIILAGGLGAGLVSTAFLLVLPAAAGGTRLAIEVLTATLAGSSLTWFATEVERQYGFLPFLPLFVIWQSGMAGLLVMMAELRPIAGVASGLTADRDGTARVGTLASAAHPPQSWPARALNAGVVLVALTALWVTFSPFIVFQIHRVDAGKAPAVPARKNLPPVQALPLDEALILRAIGPFESLGGRVHHKPGDALDDLDFSPEFRLYTNVYVIRLAADAYQMNVYVWQYPNSDWARYETCRAPGMTQRTVNDQSVLWSESEFRWYSGDKRVAVNAGSAEFLPLVEAYLAKYPSALEPGR